MVCGSPVPNKLKDTRLMWIPAGLLDGVTLSQVSVHLHLTSAATWAKESDSCVWLEDGPDSLEALNQALQRKNR